MKHPINEKIEIPSGVNCSYQNYILVCKGHGAEVARKIDIPGIKISVQNNAIVFEAPKGNKNEYKKVMASFAHIRNLFAGLQKTFAYRLEVCNVHFPMSLKVEPTQLVINNFLGEKQSRSAEILPHVKVEVKANQITVSSPNREAAGQTAANIERATKITNRDRRIYQDGIFIVEKPGRDI